MINKLALALVAGLAASTAIAQTTGPAMNPGTNTSNGGPMVTTPTDGNNQAAPTATTTAPAMGSSTFPSNASPSNSATTTTDANRSTEMAQMGNDGVMMKDGKWYKDGRPATNAEIKSHKDMMTKHGTGQPR